MASGGLPQAPWCRGEAFKDTRPWEKLDAAIRVAQAAGNSLQVIANFQRQPRFSDQTKGYFVCELCRVMPTDERPGTNATITATQASCLSCGDCYCPEHFTEHHASCNPEIKGDIKVHDQAFVKRAEKAAAPKTCGYSMAGGCRGKQPPHYGQSETCDSYCVLNQKQHEKIKPVKRQKTAAEKLKAKEAKLKRATDLAAFQEAEDLLRADTAANDEWFVCNYNRCPLQKKLHSGPFATCLLCRTMVATCHSRRNSESKKAQNARAYQASKKRKLEATMQGQTKLHF